MKMLQLIKHSLSKVFMAKHLLMDFKTSLFTKLAPTDFWLFTKLKSTLRGQKFQDTKAIAISVITATLKVISKDQFHKCFWQRQDHWAKSTAAKGDYFEGNTFSFSCKCTGICAVKSFSYLSSHTLCNNLKHKVVRTYTVHDNRISLHFIKGKPFAVLPNQLTLYLS